MNSSIHAWGSSETGKKRGSNQDNFIIDKQKKIMAVADGMGGAVAGELASHIFVRSVAEFKQRPIPESSQEAARLVQDIFRQANQAIREHVRSNPEHEGMGCTAEIISFYHGGVLVGHVGDSRTYRFRKGILTQLSKDHSFIQDQLDHGLITPEEAYNHRMRHIILRAVGTEDELQVDLIQGLYLNRDIYLLCSDGLTDMVDDASIRDTLESPSALDKKGSKLISSALEAGGLDNITLVLVEVLNKA